MPIFTSEIKDENADGSTTIGHNLIIGDPTNVSSLRIKSSSTGQNQLIFSQVDDDRWKIFMFGSATNYDLAVYNYDTVANQLILRINGDSEIRSNAGTGLIVKWATSNVSIPNGNLQVNNITNVAGTGAPDFPQGLTSKGINIDTDSKSNESINHGSRLGFNDVFFTPVVNTSMSENTSSTAKIRISASLTSTLGIQGTLYINSDNGATGGYSYIVIEYYIQRYFSASYRAVVSVRVNSRSGTGAAYSTYVHSAGVLDIYLNTGNNGTSTTTAICAYTTYFSRQKDSADITLSTL